MSVSEWMMKCVDLERNFQTPIEGGEGGIPSSSCDFAGDEDCVSSEEWVVACPNGLMATSLSSFSGFECWDVFLKFK